MQTELLVFFPRCVRSLLDGPSIVSILAVTIKTIFFSDQTELDSCHEINKPPEMLPSLTSNMARLHDISSMTVQSFHEDQDWLVRYSYYLKIITQFVLEIKVIPRLISFVLFISRAAPNPKIK